MNHPLYSQKRLEAVTEDQLQTLLASLGPELRQQVGQERCALLYLSGPMGAGKSVCARALLAALGVQGRIKSPTYALVEPYEVKKGAHKGAGESPQSYVEKLAHWDLYRLNQADELEYLGFRDYLDSARLQLVEWPERCEGVLPAPDLWLHLNFHTQTQGSQKAEPCGEPVIAAFRDIVISAYTPQGAKTLNFV